MLSPETTGRWGKGAGELLKDNTESLEFGLLRKQGLSIADLWERNVLTTTLQLLKSRKRR